MLTSDCDGSGISIEDAVSLVYPNKLRSAQRRKDIRRGGCIAVESVVLPAVIPSAPAQRGRVTDPAQNRDRPIGERSATQQFAKRSSTRPTLGCHLRGYGYTSSAQPPSGSNPQVAELAGEMIRHLRKLRDPLYGYVYLSELENRMIKHPLLLRLHYLHQNGTAYLTYPSAHPMRFGHSLGTMHVAGQLVVAALINATSEVDDSLSATVSTFLEQSDLAEGRTGPKLLDALCADKGTIDQLRQDGLYRLNHFDRNLDDWRSMVHLLLYQGVRLACLVHDLGHPPFSHTTEGAFQQAFSTGEHQYSNHEEIGLVILTEVIRDLVRDGTAPLFARAAFLLAKELSTKNGTSPLKGIAAIVSSDVDADRVDYVRRDTLTAGLAANSYDLGRLLDAATFVVDQDNKPHLIYTTDALSMLEAFFQARFHLYRWMLWHHNVLRINLALSRATYLLMTAAPDDLPQEVASRRRRLRDVACLQQGATAYVHFNDSTFFNELDNILKSLEEWVQSGRTLKASAQELHRLLRVFIRRETSLLPALWKRPDAYFHFADTVVMELRKQDRDLPHADSIPAFNMLLKERYSRHLPKVLGRKSDANLSLCQEIEGALHDATGRRFKAVYLSSFSPAPDRNFALYTRSNLSRIKIDHISPTIASLRKVWDDLPHLWLFAEAVDGEHINVEETRRVAAQALAGSFLEVK